MPLRTCLGCRKVVEKALLRRFVGLGGVLAADMNGVLPGRGAYVCGIECLKQLFKRKEAFSRALRKRVDLPDIEVFAGSMPGGLNDKTGKS